MLKKLTIKNIALIDYVEIDFSKGFNVLSGETGAGKSIIIESLNFVLGARSDYNLIRSGQTECVVTAEFDVSENYLINEVYDKLDFDKDETLIISRKLTIDKKNTIKINGNSANVSMVRNFTDALVDVHGQSEHFSLLSSANQLSLLDDFSGEDLLEIKNPLKANYLKYKTVLSQLDQLGGDEDKRLLRLDVINFQINEIEKANLTKGEEEKLLEIKEKLKHQQKILSALSTIKECINQDNGILDGLSIAKNSVNTISDLSNDYSVILDRIENVYAEIDDIGDTASNLIDNFDFSEYSEEEINSRLDLLKNLKRKYGDYNQTIDFLNKIIEEKERLENFNEENEKLLKEKERLQSTIYDLYLKTSNIRKKFAKSLSNDITNELKQLGMPNARFTIDFKELQNIEDCSFNSSNGIDQINFLFSANLGEPLKPLSSVISGGEISRFMLAVKVVCSKYNKISTFIFDEIDSGISGIIARTVAEKLYLISKNVQVIAISHLPQIASFSDNSLLIYKTEEDNKAKTNVKTLNKDEKIEEITRLIGGTLNQSSKEHSISLITSAEEYKKSL